MSRWGVDSCTCPICECVRVGCTDSLPYSFFVSLGRSLSTGLFKAGAEIQLLYVYIHLNMFVGEFGNPRYPTVSSSTIPLGFRYGRDVGVGGVSVRVSVHVFLRPKK